MVDRNGNVVNNYSYDEWGNITASSETVSNPFKYAGEVYDSETGLYYLRARYYDPTVGRFINEDTIEGQVTNPLSLNVYTYCGNSPVGYVDPSGHIPIAPLLAKAGANGAADFMTQLFMNYYFNSNTAGDIGASIGAVNWWQVARSTLEGLIPWKTPGGRLGRAAVTAVGDVLVNALYYGNDYSVEQALQDFGIGFIGDLAGGGIGELISKYGTRSVARGLSNLGMDETEISKLTGIDISSKALRSLNSLDDFINNPSLLNSLSPSELYDYLIIKGYNPQPLSGGSLAGISFEDGGGFKVNWGGDRILQYHPSGGHHGGVSYWKISSGATGTQRYDMNGNLIR